MAIYKIAFGIGDDTLPETQMFVDTAGWDASSRESFDKMLTAGKGTWKVYARPNQPQDRPLQTIGIERQ